MAARRDRQELGEALDDAEDDGVEDRHGGRTLPGAWSTARCAAATAGARRSGGRRPVPRATRARNDGRTVEVGHLDVGGAERRRARGRRSRRRRARSCSAANAAARSFSDRSDVLALSTSRASTSPSPTSSSSDPSREAVAHRVERVRHVHEAALARGSRVAASAAPSPNGRRSVEEQADDLAAPGAQLLADDDAARQPLGQLDRAVDRAVVGDAQHVDARLGDRLLELVGRRRASRPTTSCASAGRPAPSRPARGSARCG